MRNKYVKRMCVALVALVSLLLGVFASGKFIAFLLGVLTGFVTYYLLCIAFHSIPKNVKYKFRRFVRMRRRTTYYR